RSISPPSRYTLFPYTTLFRSGIDDIRQVLCRHWTYEVLIRLRGQSLPQLFQDNHLSCQERSLPVHPLLCEQDPDMSVSHHERQTDRKSTRLNSSHVKISYAVF